MKHYIVKPYCGDSTNYYTSLCIIERESEECIMTPGFLYNEEDEDMEEPIGYYAFPADSDDAIEFTTEEELDKFMEEYAEKLNAVERSKWVCLKRNAKRRLKKELASWVKDNAEMMGWPVKFFRNACLLAVSHYEVSIDEVMKRELMFAV